MRLEAMAITMPEVADHPNRTPFEGVLTLVDEASTRPPSGARTEADVIGNQLQVRGYLFGRDFPEVVQQLRQSEAVHMGMSYELANAHVADMQAEVWTLTRATFTGAAILLREKAAYRNTSFRLSAGRCRNSVSMREGTAKLATHSSWRFEKQSFGQTQRRKEA